MGETRTTKEEIVQLLKINGEHTVAELAKSLDITEMAVRRHLSKLEKEQLIDSKNGKTTCWTTDIFIRS